MKKNIIELKHKDLTEKILKIFYKVYNKLGYGFLEKVYENAMMIEFEKAGITVIAQAPIKVGLLLNFGTKPAVKRRVF